MADKKGLAAEFRDFIAGGNMIELAVAVILAGAIALVSTRLRPLSERRRGERAS